MVCVYFSKRLERGRFVWLKAESHLRSPECHMSCLRNLFLSCTQPVLPHFARPFLQGAVVRICLHKASLLLPRARLSLSDFRAGSPSRAGCKNPASKDTAIPACSLALHQSNRATAQPLSNSKRRAGCHLWQVLAWFLKREEENSGSNQISGDQGIVRHEWSALKSSRNTSKANASSLSLPVAWRWCRLKF